MISNINYRGYIRKAAIDQMKFNNWKPRQCVIKMDDFTLVIFQSGKCRIMGCKKPISQHRIQVKDIKVTVECIQSITVTVDMGITINLHQVAKKHQNTVFEPELFRALRINAYRPLCVNVFSTGKVVILGLRSFVNINETVNGIISTILQSIVV